MERSRGRHSTKQELQHRDVPRLGDLNCFAHQLFFFARKQRRRDLSCAVFGSGLPTAIALRERAASGCGLWLPVRWTGSLSLHRNVLGLPLLPDLGDNHYRTF